MDVLSAAGFLLGIECCLESGRRYPPWVDRGAFQLHAWTARQLVYDAVEVDGYTVQAMQVYVSLLVEDMHMFRARRLRKRNRDKDAKAARDARNSSSGNENDL